jgi:hypothetical protein
MLDFMSFLVGASSISGFWSLKETRFLPGVFYVGQIHSSNSLGLVHSKPRQPNFKLGNLLVTLLDFALSQVWQKKKKVLLGLGVK